MADKRKRMTVDDHKRLGAELKQMRDRLVTITVQLDSEFKTSARIADTANKCTWAIDKLRSLLDSHLIKYYPELPDKELFSVYYPGNTAAEEFMNPPHIHEGKLEE